MAKINIKANLPDGISNGSSVFADGGIYLFGGEDSNGDVTDAIYYYDVNNDSWTNTETTLTYPLKNAVAVAVEDAIYIFGGYDENGMENHAILKYYQASCVDTADTTTLTNFKSGIYVSSERKIILTNNSTTYEIFNVDTHISTTTTDSKLQSYTYVTPNTFTTFNGSEVKVYERNVLEVGNLISSHAISGSWFNALAFEFIRGELLIITFSSSAITFYRYDYVNNEMTSQYNINAYYTDYTNFSFCGEDNIAYLIGGVYDDFELTTRTTQLDFNYYLVNYTFNPVLIAITPLVYEIGILDRFNCTISENNTQYNLVESSVDLTYGEYETTDYITYDGDNTIININEVKKDIYVSVSSMQYHQIKLNLSDGVTPSVDGDVWYKGTAYLRIYSIQSGYEVRTIKIMNGDMNITSDVFDEDTMTLILSPDKWDDYNDVSVTIVASTPKLYVNLYKNISGENVVDKNIQLIYEINGVLREGTNILSPTILVDTTNIDISLANYVYIENFKRYYYITSMNVERNNLWRMNLRVDVLMTYQNEIKNLECLVSRSSSNYNRLLPDGEDVLSSKPIIEIEEIKNDVFSNGETEDHFVIITAS